jgi:hypothetical protein
MSSSPTESIRFAGDVNIRRLEIVSSSNYKVDITNQLIGMEIYEDIFAPFTSIAITVRESEDFINALPLRGEEILNMEVSTPTFKKEEMYFKGRYYVYSISDRILLTDRNSAYTLNCISYEALVDLNMKQSKAYRGNIGEIAQELIKVDLNTTKNYKIEPTKNSIKYVSNFWSPIKNLNYLSTNAVNNDGNSSYLFFESRSGFNFTTLDKLYTQEIYQRFIKDNYSRDTDGNTSVRNLDRDYQRILDYKVRIPFDALKFTNNGAYASRLYAHDLVKKKYIAKDYNALDQFKNGSHLNKNPMFTEAKPVSPANFVFNYTKHYGSHNGFADTSNTQVIQQRNSKLALIRSCVIELNVFGRSDYTVGQKVYVELPKPTVITEKDQANTDKKTGYIDTAYSGNYIITAINHIISREDHKCVLELSKESMMG